MSIKSARIAAGKTQKDIAEALGISIAAVSYWETGQAMPRAAMLARLATLLGVTVDELIREG